MENRLIAEFMGLETPDGVYFEHLTKNGERSKLTHFMLLEYHTSWDWLIPVVDKCYQDGRLYNPYRMEIVASLSGVIDMEDTYYSVVDFIKNQNK
jgi:hypothetical protein